MINKEGLSQENSLNLEDITLWEKMSPSKRLNVSDGDTHEKIRKAWLDLSKKFNASVVAYDSALSENYSRIQQLLNDAYEKLSPIEDKTQAEGESLFGGIGYGNNRYYREGSNLSEADKIFNFKKCFEDWFYKNANYSFQSVRNMFDEYVKSGVHPRKLTESIEFKLEISFIDYAAENIAGYYTHDNLERIKVKRDQCIVLDIDKKKLVLPHKTQEKACAEFLQAVQVRQSRSELQGISYIILDYMNIGIERSELIKILKDNNFSLKELGLVE